VLAASVQCHLPSDRERLEHWAEIRQNGATKKENEAVWSYSTNNLTERTKERRKRTKERGGWYIPFSPRSRTDTGDWANEKRKIIIIQRKNQQISGRHLAYPTNIEIGNWTDRVETGKRKRAKASVSFRRSGTAVILWNTTLSSTAVYTRPAGTYKTTCKSLSVHHIIRPVKVFLFLEIDQQTTMTSVANNVLPSYLVRVTFHSFMTFDSLFLLLLLLLLFCWVWISLIRMSGHW
jgi:hypothetical protein